MSGTGGVTVGWEMMALLAGLKTLNLVLGGVITYYAYRAYRRTGVAALGAVAAGFAIVTFGVLIAGFVDQLPLLHTELALIVEAVFTAVGFFVILYSLHM